MNNNGYPLYRRQIFVEGIRFQNNYEDVKQFLLDKVGAGASVTKSETDTYFKLYEDGKITKVYPDQWLVVDADGVARVFSDTGLNELFIKVEQHDLDIVA